MLVKLNRLGKEFAGKWLFRSLEAQCNQGDHVGLIGRNGVGKTTLFDLIEGRLIPDEGSIELARRLKVARVEQRPEFDPDARVRSVALEVFDDLRKMEERLGELEAEIAEQGLSGELGHRYENLRHEFSMGGGYDYRARTEAVLYGLGFEKNDLDRPCRELSGGQISRLLLARALVRSSDLLLLDEPTNHLDLAGIFWLTDYLQDKDRSLIVVSHDREFLDAVTSKIWEIEGGTLFSYSGGYSKSRRLRQERRQRQREAYEKQQEWKRRTEDFIRRNIVGQKTKQAQSRRKQLEETEWIEEPSTEEGSRLALRIPEATRGGGLVFEIRDGDIGYEPELLIEGLNLRLQRGERLGIVGPNGSGKTTLLKTLMGEIPLLRGKVDYGHRYIPRYFSQSTQLSETDQTVFEWLAGFSQSWRDEEIRSFAARFGFRGEEVEKKLSALSGGERSRLSLARLFYRSANVLFLDEPTNHLDIYSREALEKALQKFSGAVVVVSHDLYFLKETVERFLVIEQGVRHHLVDRLGRVRELLEREGPSPSEERAPAKSPDRKGPRDRGLSKNERARLQARIKTYESEISDLEEKKQEISRRLSEGSEDHGKLRSWSQEYESADEELARLYQSWEEVVHRLDEAEASGG